MINNYYNDKEIDEFIKYESKLVFSKNFRRLNGKTQLFSAQKGDHFRNRMVHTNEVRVIAMEIANRINRELSNNLINLNLVSCIAIAHDFGHTPFGHVGERTIQDIFSKEDNLGLIFEKGNFEKMFFKHNINSMRLLVNEFKDDIPWQILDGVLKHSKLSYGSNENFNVSYILPKTTYDEIYFKFKDSCLPLTLEGQIVRIADEIAQRYSDFEDTFRARNINSLKKIFEKIEDYGENNCLKYIDELLNVLIQSVVKQSCININSRTFSNNDELMKYLSTNEVIAFDERGSKLNCELESFIKECIFKIDELRQEDEKNKFIIRQLFKAYYNNCDQIGGDSFIQFIENMYNSRKRLYKEKKNIPDEYRVIFSFKIYDENKKEANIKEFNKFINSLKVLAQNEDVPLCINKLFSIYIQEIGYYIGSMTDLYAIKSYHYMYGIDKK